MIKPNPWVWTKLTEELKPDRKAGDPVPIEYLTEGYLEYFPYAAWIKKGYVKKIVPQIHCDLCKCEINKNDWSSILDGMSNVCDNCLEE